MVLEPLDHASKGEDIDSMGESLEIIVKLNNRRRDNELEERDENDESEKSRRKEKEKLKKKNVKKKGQSFMEGFKKKRVEKLKHLKIRNSVLPNMKAKLWAMRLLYEKQRAEERK